MKFESIRKRIANWFYPYEKELELLENLVEIKESTLNAQMQYITMLHDNTTSMYSSMSGMVQPIIESNKILQSVLNEEKLKN